MRTLSPALLLLIATTAACGEDASDCDATALQRSLDVAAAGATVEAGACIFPGPLTIPAGVTLAGAGPAATIVTAPEGGTALVLVPGSTATAAVDLSVESAGCAGVVARGAGDVTLERVSVSASSGIGIGVEGVDHLTLSAVYVVGPITRETADETTPPLPPFTCGSSPLATHGLVLVDVVEAELDDLETNGFAAFGALLVRSGTTWRVGGAADNLGTGLEIWGGGATLESLTLHRTRDGLGAIESFNGVIASGAEVRTVSLLVADGDSYGLMHDAATGRHSGLMVRDHGFAGLWSQGAPALQLTASELIDNGFAGVAAIDGADVALDGVRVEGTVERLSIGGARTIRAADGVQLVRSAGMVSDLVLVANERAGLLLELGGGSTSSVSVAGVMVDGSGPAFGAVAQNGTLESGWDSGVTRAGDTVANDAAFTGALDVAGAVGPPCLPPLADVETAGLDALLGP